MEIGPMGVKLFHAGGSWDRYEEAKVAFNNFANVPKMHVIYLYSCILN
jgi:hypothetical protein